MSAQPFRPDDESPTSLRAALLNPPAPPKPAASEKPDLHLSASVQDAALLPTAPELLAASPNLQRLCESYHNTRRRMVERGRRQRLGIAALVCGLAVGATVLAHQGSLPANMVNILVVSVAAASAVGLVVLGWLWVRDERKLRQAQGERLLRALQFNCTLPEENLRAFRRLVAPTSAFFDVYNAWKLEHPDRRSVFAIFASALSGKSQRAAA
jgi:hypothetical protein